MHATPRRIIDVKGLEVGRFRTEQVTNRPPARLTAKVGEVCLAKQIRRLEAQRGVER